MNLEYVLPSDIERRSFEIIESEKEYGDIFISPDIATCDKCREELFDKNNRRYFVYNRCSVSGSKRW